MAKPHKKQIYEPVHKHFDDESFTGNIDDIIFMLEKLKISYPKYSRLFLTEDHYRIDDYWGVEVYGQREETDEEYNKRIERARKNKESKQRAKERKAKEREERDRKEFERLKAKYEET